MNDTGIVVSGGKSKKAARKASIGHRQAILYMETRLRESKFRKKIFLIRKEYDIPPNGLQRPESPLREVYGPPSNWLEQSTEKQRQERFNELATKMLDFMLELGYVTSLLMPSPALNYIFFNELTAFGSDAHRLGIPFPLDALSVDSCFFYDENANNAERKTANTELKRVIDKRTAVLDKNYPIVLRIRSDATQNQVNDYIYRVFSWIEDLQKAYKEKDSLKGRLRQRDQKSKKRDEIIDNFKDRPWAELQIELRKQGFIPEKSEIASIRAKHKGRLKRLR